MRANAEYFVRTMNKANGGTRSHLLFKNGFGADICYHPLGGIVLGESTNALGRLNQHNNLVCAGWIAYTRNHWCKPITYHNRYRRILYGKPIAAKRI